MDVDVVGDVNVDIDVRTGQILGKLFSVLS